ncbi:MAG: hypothetical protein IPO92_22620 [Saprospiraceae bacterium]|nr:hypothetical protein [Saprospiraceae bacterium]
MNISFKSVLFLSMLAFVTLASFTVVDINRWEKLGERKVDLGLDHDQILVGVGDGKFAKLKIIVRNSGINLHKMVVHYGNGDKQDINIRRHSERWGKSGN